jgi:hypothetical protein
MVPNFNAMFRSLISESPLAPAFNPASQQARRYLEQGGAAGARAKEKRGEIADFAVPRDLDPALRGEVARARRPRVRAAHSDAAAVGTGARRSSARAEGRAAAARGR